MIKKMRFFIFFAISCLQGDASLMHLCQSPKIFTIAHFLTDEECDHMIKIAFPHLIDSKVVDEKNIGEMSDSRRSSRGCFIHNFWTDPVLIEIERKIAAISGCPIENGEDLQILHYGLKGEYQPHYDYFNGDTPGGAECLLRGGQRISTMIMYLNTPEGGGETIFPRAKIKITPRKGDAVFFYNCTPDGCVDPKSLHGGAPVTAGEKWIMTKWIRERKF